MARIRVGEFLPDLPAYESPGTPEALNVLPALRSYGPFPGLAELGGALPERCQGLAAVRAPSGVVRTFAGTASTLHMLDSGTWAWIDVSRTMGGPYATPPDGRWSFAVFGDLLTAWNGVDQPQAISLSGPTNFAALGGAPPAAAFAATVLDFLMAGNVVGSRRRLVWSGIDDATAWTPSAVTLSDVQDIADGGDITGILGGEFGTIFQREAIRRASFIGPPEVWRLEEVSHGVGCVAPGSVAGFRNNAMFLAEDGFKLLAGLTQVVDVGRDKVDRYFWSDVQAGSLHRVCGAFEPTLGMYAVVWPGTGSADGNPNRGMVFSLSTGRWARFEAELEWFTSALQQTGSYDLEGLDAISTSLDLLPASLDSPTWVGNSRPALAAFSLARRLGFFIGPAMAATVDTADYAPSEGRRTRITGCRPVTDAATASVAIGVRNRLSEPVAWQAPVPQNGFGFVPLDAEGRYLRARIEIPAGQQWSHIQGLDDVELDRGGAW